MGSRQAILSLSDTGTFWGEFPKRYIALELPKINHNGLDFQIREKKIAQALKMTQDRQEARNRVRKE